MQQAWQSLPSFLDHCQRTNTSPIFRLLLASDGTTVRNFRALFFSYPRLELVAQQEVTLDESTAKQLSLPPGEKALERRVWLRAHQEGQEETRFMYAISTLATAHLAPDFAQILQRDQLPLGQIIEQKKLPSFRDALEVACLPFPEVARGLSLKEETLFWARRYRLVISGHVSALICEVFSPQLSSFSD